MIGRFYFVLRIIIPLIISSPSFASEAFFELPVIFSTSYSPALSTELKPGIGLGLTQFPLSLGPFRFGYGALFTFSPLLWQGTKDVYAVGFEQDLETRAYFAYAFDGTNISFWPYAFVGPNAGFRLTKIAVYSSSESVIYGDLGVRGGLGLKTRFGDVAVKIDSSVGYAFSGLNLRTSIIFGFGIF